MKKENQKQLIFDCRLIVNGMAEQIKKSIKMGERARLSSHYGDEMLHALNTLFNFMPKKALEVYLEAFIEDKDLVLSFERLEFLEREMINPAYEKVDIRDNQPSVRDTIFTIY